MGITMIIHSNRVWAAALCGMLSIAASLNAQIDKGTLITTLPKPTTTTPTVYNGAPPAAFRLSGTTPVSASFAWDATAGAMTYTILRTSGIGQQWVTLTPTPLPAATLSYVDNAGIDYRSSYTYRLQVNYNGTPPGYTDMTVNLVKPLNPGGLTAKQTGDGAVSISWSPVSGVSGYTVFGPGIPGGAVTVTSTNASASGIPLGAQSWSVASVYQPGNITTPAAEFPAVSTTVEKWIGNYRISVIGFTNQSATTDDPTNGDGVGDEILPMVYWQRFQDPNSPRLADQFFTRSAIFGDNGKSWRSRVRAGSGDPTGGILSNDIVPAGFTTSGFASSGGGGATTTATSATCAKCATTSTGLPMVVWEGQLTRNSDILVLYPSLWETDEHPEVFRTPYEQAIANRTGNVMNNAGVRAALDQPGISEVRGDLAVQMFSHGPLSIADRPIGMEAVSGKLGGSDAGFFDRMIVLNLKKIEEALSQPPKYSGLPAGTIGLSFFEPGVIWMPAPDAYNYSGKYVLYLTVERR
jgi:hypothetical protein